MSSAVAQGQQQFPFMKLPAELRLVVYDYYFELPFEPQFLLVPELCFAQRLQIPEGAIYYIRASRPRGQNRTQFTDNKRIGLLIASRLIYGEALESLYRVNKFTLTIAKPNPRRLYTGPFPLNYLCSEWCHQSDNVALGPFSNILKQGIIRRRNWPLHLVRHLKLVIFNHHVSGRPDAAVHTTICRLHGGSNLRSLTVVPRVYRAGSDHPVRVGILRGLHDFRVENVVFTEDETYDDPFGEVRQQHFLPQSAIDTTKAQMRSNTESRLKPLFWRPSEIVIAQSQMSRCLSVSTEVWHYDVSHLNSYWAVGHHPFATDPGRYGLSLRTNTGWTGILERELRNISPPIHSASYVHLPLVLPQSAPIQQQSTVEAGQPADNVDLGSETMENDWTIDEIVSFSGHGL